MPKKNFHIAVHPGEILKDILRESGLSQSDLARHLTMPQSKINEICTGKRGISSVMAHKLARAFKQSPQLWLGLQTEWELSQVTASEYESVEPIRKRA